MRYFQEDGGALTWYLLCSRSVMTSDRHYEYMLPKRRVVSVRTSRQLSEISPLNVVVGLQENLPQSGLSDRIVLQVEFVESMERIIMGVHV